MTTTQGAKRPTTTAKAAPAFGLVVMALVIVYVVWGSTYLAIRIVVEEAPPLTSMGLRYGTAALILGSVMLMRVETQASLFGYPALALVMFLLAVALGVGIVGSALLRDRRAQPKEERGLR